MASSKTEIELGMAVAKSSGSGKIEILAISDLHIGVAVDDGASIFHFSDEEVVAYLTWASQRYAAVVLVGDVFECWRADHSRWEEEFASLIESEAHGETFSDWHESMGKPRFIAIEKTYPKTVALIKAGVMAGNIKYVNGNHDACCRTNNLIPGALESFTVKQGDFTLSFWHGHQADPWCNGRNKVKIGISRFLTCFCSVEQELIDPHLDTKATALANTIGLLHDDGSIYRDHATLLAAQNGYDAVVYGHTHSIDLAGLRKKSGTNLIYANTGRVCSDAAEDDRIDEVVLAVGDTLEVTVQQRYLHSDYLNILRSVIMVDPKKPCVEKAINTRTDGIRMQMGSPAFVPLPIMQEDEAMVRDQIGVPQPEAMIKENEDGRMASVVDISSARGTPLVPAFKSGVSGSSLVVQEVEPVVVQLSGSVSRVSDEAHSKVVSALGSGIKSSVVKL